MAGLDPNSSGPGDRSFVVSELAAPCPMQYMTLAPASENPFKYGSRNGAVQSKRIRRSTSSDRKPETCHSEHETVSNPRWFFRTCANSVAKRPTLFVTIKARARLSTLQWGALRRYDMKSESNRRLCN